MGTILIEGVTSQDLVALPDDELRALVITGKPVVFRVGTATVLGEFAIRDRALILELAHIDGGGEGVLPTIAALASQIAERQDLAFIEWHVYATNCARPNLKLRRALERRGFTVTTTPGKGECYFLRVTVHAATGEP
jgi:hypothetical protein